MTTVTNGIVWHGSQSANRFVAVAHPGIELRAGSQSTTKRT